MSAWCAHRATAAQLRVEWERAFAALKLAGLEHDAGHPIAARYREASDAVNHANRKLDFGHHCEGESC